MESLVFEKRLRISTKPPKTFPKPFNNSEICNNCCKLLTNKMKSKVWTLLKCVNTGQLDSSRLLKITQLTDDVMSHEEFTIFLNED